LPSNKILLPRGELLDNSDFHRGWQFRVVDEGHFMPRFQRVRAWPAVEPVISASLAGPLICRAPSPWCERRRKRIDIDAAGNPSTSPKTTDCAIAGDAPLSPGDGRGLHVPPIAGRDRGPDETNNGILFQQRRIEWRSAGAGVTASNQVSGNTGHS
jgi:hypothetical protein